MKILLLGSTGQVGQELLQTLPCLGEVVTLTRQQLDLSQPETIEAAIAAVQPDIIVNSSAYTAVDRAESEADLAMLINAEAPKAISKVASQLGAKFLHISTDYVFDGTSHVPYSETDVPNPLGVYGKSKLLGEIAIQKNCDRYIILRTAWVYGTKGRGNFVKTMLRLGKERKELKVVSDQIGSPTWAYDIAEAVVNLLAPDVPTGIYHFTNSGVASWYDLAVTTFNEAQKLGFSLVVDSVLPITTADYPTPAKRPHYSVLANQKYTSTVATTPPYWRDSLVAMLQELETQLNQ